MTSFACFRSSSAVRFALVGVALTFGGLGIIYLLKWSLALGDVSANAIGYGAGLVASYLLNSRWTFSFRDSHRAAVPRFVLTVAVAYLANLGTVAAVIHWFGINSYLAHAMGIPPYAIITYLGSRHFAFRSRPTTTAAPIASATSSHNGTTVAHSPRHALRQSNHRDR